MEQVARKIHSIFPCQKGQGTYASCRAGWTSSHRLAPISNLKSVPGLRTHFPHHRFFMASSLRLLISKHIGSRWQHVWPFSKCPRRFNGRVIDTSTADAATTATSSARQRLRPASRRSPRSRYLPGFPQFSSCCRPPICR
jgi:hypothetical protein